MRADLYLLEQGVFETRAQAQAAIAAGRVRIGGTVIAKPSQKVQPGAEIEAQAAHPYVGRAALKLVAGLDQFGIDPSGRTCLDVGSSTGGFTEVLLERGATRVFAVDVGRDQLHSKLRNDPRVTVLEGTDARQLTAAEIAEPPELIVCDASFIGLAKVIERPLSLAAERAEAVLLFKPQFEVGRAYIGKGGVVKDDIAVQASLERFRIWVGDRTDFSITGVTDSPISGGDGNREFLIAARKG
ncbi:MAG: TlyA family rRNA (cytidine-2'-O)-methyltransferase [Alphaproteobacteria bacterium]|nr:TlyA family rRNA (cytidine-2'-O)-methyltransferase [Alphaproteobacteria bacterium]